MHLDDSVSKFIELHGAKPLMPLLLHEDNFGILVFKNNIPGLINSFGAQILEVDSREIQNLIYDRPFGLSALFVNVLRSKSERPVKAGFVGEWSGDFKIVKFTPYHFTLDGENLCILLISLLEQYNTYPSIKHLTATPLSEKELGIFLRIANAEKNTRRLLARYAHNPNKAKESEKRVKTAADLRS